MKTKLTLFIFVLIASSCSSFGSRDRDLLKDRFLKLEHLSRYPAKTCTIETTLSEPVKIKYLQLYPRESNSLLEGSWTYQWTVMESRCDVTSGRAYRSSELIKSHRAILKAALCTLLQTHWVNSPFDDMRVESEQLENQDEAVVVHQKGISETDKNIGMWIYKNDFLIETRTKTLGILRAHYLQRNHEWLPDWLEQRLPTSQVRVDQISYGAPPSGRTPIESLWISVGAEELSAHTFVKVTKCY